MSWYWYPLIIAGCFVIIIYIYNLLTRKYVSPYTLDIYFGRKGCGKSSTLQKLAQKYYKLGWNCYCDLGNTMQPFVKPINCRELYKYQLPPNSVVFIDEINLLWDNRDFKSFPKPLQDYLRKQRHKRVKLIMFSQTYDCDLKIRNLADKLYLCNKLLRVFTVCRAYVKRPVILTSVQTHTEGRMSDDFAKLPFWCNVVTFIPKWVKKYNSFEDDLTSYEFDISTDYKYLEYVDNNVSSFTLYNSSGEHISDVSLTDGLKAIKRNNGFYIVEKATGERIIADDVK